MESCKSSGQKVLLRKIFSRRPPTWRQPIVMVGPGRSLRAIGASIFWGTLLCFWGGCDRPQTKEELLGSTSPELRKLLDPPAGSSIISTPMMTAGIEDPKMLAAAQARLDAHAMVIGVVVDGQPRAYPLSKLSGMLEHVVNDVVIKREGGALPLTVTYCDMTDCARVFVPEDASVEGSLRIGTLGLLDGGLALTYQNANYKQTDTIPGLAEFDAVRTTWEEWLETYPHTLVYGGAELGDVRQQSDGQQSGDGQQVRERKSSEEESKP